MRLLRAERLGPNESYLIAVSARTHHAATPPGTPTRPGTTGHGRRPLGCSIYFQQRRPPLRYAPGLRIRPPGTARRPPRTPAARTGWPAGSSARWLSCSEPEPESLESPHHDDRVVRTWRLRAVQAGDAEPPGAEGWAEVARVADRSWCDGEAGEGEVTPPQRAHLMRLSAWTCLALGFFLGAALLAWWFS